MNDPVQYVTNKKINYFGNKIWKVLFRDVHWSLQYLDLATPDEMVCRIGKVNQTNNLGLFQTTQVADNFITSTIPLELTILGLSWNEFFFTQVTPYIYTIFSLCWPVYIYTLVSWIVGKVQGSTQTSHHIHSYFCENSSHVLGWALSMWHIKFATRWHLTLSG